MKHGWQAVIVFLGLLFTWYVAGYYFDLTGRSLGALTETWFQQATAVLFYTWFTKV